MKKTGKKGLIFYLSMSIIVISIIIGIVNVFLFRNCDFFRVNIAQLLTIAVAILFAFWATQQKTEERRVKDQIEKITYKIQEVVSSTNFISFNTSQNSEYVQKMLNLNTRKVNNCVTLLKEYSDMIDIKKEIDYISEQVNEYREFISEKTNDLEYLEKSEAHLRKISDNISAKCDFIILKLYKTM